MIRTMKLAVLAMAGACALSACSPLGRALAPELRQVEVRMKPRVTCSQLASALSSAGETMSVAQLNALYAKCEEMQAGTIIDPQAAREAGLPVVPGI